MIHSVAASAAIALTLVLLLCAFILTKRNIKVSRLTRPLSLVMLGTAFLEYCYDHVAVYYVRGLNSELSPFYADGAGHIETAIAIILIWFSYAAMLTIVLNEFFENRVLKAITNCFSLPVFILLICLFGIYGRGVFGNDYSLSTVRLWMIVAVIGMAISIPLCHILEEKRFIYPRKKELYSFFLALPFSVLAAMPCYVLQAFFESADPNLKLFDFTEEHRFMLYGAIVIPVIIYFFLRDRSENTKRLVMVYMSLAFLWVYLGRWTLEMWKTPTSWPLHLCNTAMFLIPLCFVFKMNRLFNFCLFINVMGALLAMMIPGKLSGLNAIGTERVSFWLNHYAAFFMPVLAVALKMFKRPKFKEWVYAVIALTFYFCAMLFTNTLFTEMYQEECDYFFLNSDFIVSTLGAWAERTRDFILHVNFGKYTLTFYPVYQSLFYIVYIGFTVMVWFIYALLFEIWDKAEDRRLRERDYKRMKKELKDFLGEKSKYEPLSGDDSPRLVLRNFSKRYGTNKHYSVKDVSLDVKGGEIFGFLGPNGAGKSTIIKSMVGIQTITEGQIEICGYDVEKQAAMSKFQMGFVPDHYALYENLTGREYINYIADLYMVSQEYRDSIIEKLVDRFQLTGSFDNQMKTYSHGMKQKITIMSALVHNPKVWILDEPLTGLDPTSIYEVKECMKEHAAAGNVVFFSSHIIDLVEKLCDRIAIIKKGQLRACVPIADLARDGIELEQFYLSIINSGNDEHVPFTEEDEKAVKAATADENTVKEEI